MATSKTVSIKLLIDRNANRVLFAEAGKEFVDFLFNFLSLPVGTMVELPSADAMVGCVGNLYKSVYNMEDAYMLSGKNKNTLLSPTVQNHAIDVLLLPQSVSSSAPTSTMKFYMCPRSHSNCRRTIANILNASCSNCGSSMNVEMKLIEEPVDSNEAKGSSESCVGFVKGVVTYMIMDNLEVSPMSTISSIAMLNKFQVKEVGALQEKVVELGMTEGLKLLKASLASKTVLSDVFIAKKS